MSIDNTKFHDCDVLKSVLPIIHKIHNYKSDTDYVYIMKTNGFWEIFTHYWNDEYDTWDVTSAPIISCPYCGAKLVDNHLLND